MKKKATNSIELTFPKVVCLGYYVSKGHYDDWENIVISFKELTGKKIKWVDIGYINDFPSDVPSNIALFYIGKRPTKKEIETNLKKWIKKISV